jgi:hypothetical protein
MTKRILAIIVFFGLTTSAHAFDIVAWATAGAACVPDRLTNDRFDAFNPATVRHNGAQVGSLVFTCHVERFDSPNQSWVLRMNYRDSTGVGATASVVAQLYRIPVVNGFTPVAVGSDINSDVFAPLGNTTQVQAFNHTFDFEANTYFVQVALTRASTSEIVRLSTVSIEVGSPD